MPLPEAHTPVVMLSSVDRRDDRSRSWRGGVAAFVTKPVRRDDLRSVLADSLTGTGRNVKTSTKPQPVGSAAHRALKILLADDNRVNQKVAVRILEGGEHQVTVVDNGSRYWSGWPTASSMSC